MQSLINISSSITVTVALPQEDEQDVLAFTREVWLTGGRLGQWRSARIERMYCAAFSRIPPPTAASLLLPLRPASATLVSWIRFTVPPADWLGRMRGKKKQEQKQKSIQGDGWIVFARAAKHRCSNHFRPSALRFAKESVKREGISSALIRSKGINTAVCLSRAGGRGTGTRGRHRRGA